MVRADTLDLIAENPAPHGIFDTIQETRRTVYCTERSVSQTEIYQAQAVGLNPALKLVLAHAFEYGGEKLCEYKGIRYRILRTYVDTGDFRGYNRRGYISDAIELTLEPVDGNAADMPPAPPAPEPEEPEEPEETEGTGGV